MSKKYEELKMNIAGVEFKNPFVLGSAPPTKDADRIIRAARMGWAGAVHKTIALEPTVDPSPRMEARKLGDEVTAVQNIELITTYHMSEWEKMNKRIKNEAPSGFVLITSIMGVPDPETWIEPLQVAQESGADMVELNVSCPHGSPEHFMGAFIGQDAKLTGKIVSYVKRYAKVPVIVKLTPNVTDIRPIAEEALKGGADALTLTNTHGPVIIGVDIESATPLPNVRGFSAFGGMSGPAIKPIVMRIVAEVAKSFPNVEIFGLGGVSSWHDAVEYMMLGAKGIQVVTGVMLYGYGLIDDLLVGTAEFLKEHGYSSVEEVVGKALPRIVAHSDLNFDKWARSWIDPWVCVPCTRCITTCTDVGEGAIYMDPEELVAKVDTEKCSGCGICRAVCPTGAIQILPKEEAERRNKEIKVKLTGFEHLTPSSLEEAVSLLKTYTPYVRVLAGGTDLLVRMKQGQEEPRYLVDIRNVKDLDFIEVMNGAVRIGSATKLSEIENSEIVKEELPVLHEAVGFMGLEEIRKVGTIGGNLCNASPAADTAPALLVLDAKVVATGPNGKREIPMEEFFVGPGRTSLKPEELLAEILIPRPPKGAGTSFLKAARTKTDIAKVNVAVYLIQRDGVVDACRIALGAVAPTPVRVRKAEEALVGKELSDEAIKRAAQIVPSEIRPITDIRATAKERREISKVLTKRALNIARERMHVRP
jgi:dihydropyrimidine dehydrogenase (NAD+) subunit PreA